jgi:hypothetical protein
MDKNLTQTSLSHGHNNLQTNGFNVKTRSSSNSKKFKKIQLAVCLLLELVPFFFDERVWGNLGEKEGKLAVSSFC